ncbi:transposase [Pontibacter sp. XAAS-A31]|nr:transposase [Pontibacter harenae]
MKYCQQHKGLELYAWCLMSNHLHLIAGAAEGKKLSDILRDFKKFSSKAIVKAIQEENESRKEWLLNRFSYAAANDTKTKNYKFWQEGNESKELHTNAFLEQKLQYIHQNPVVAEIVAAPEHYLYSSALNYTGQKGLLDVLLLE